MPARKTWDESGKVCIACKAHKALAEFYVHTRRNGNLNVSGRCRPCSTKRNAEWRASFPPGVLRRLYRWGITEDEYRKMLADQDGVCAICKEREPDHVDHDHETGRVRALLCRRCNVGLPMVEDARLHEAALAYLARCREDQRDGQDTFTAAMRLPCVSTSP